MHARTDKDGGAVVPPDAVEELAGLLLVCGAGAATAFVQALHARGVPMDTLYLELMAPSARHLGALWERDTVGFADVTVGLCRLHEVMNVLSPVFHGTAEVARTGQRALFVTVPGEQHAFAVGMVAAFFQRAGWEAWTACPRSRDELAAIVRSRSFAVVGFSVFCDRWLDPLAACIRIVRKVSRNRSIRVMVGGRVFMEHPEYVPLVGADATASDGRDAVRQAQKLLALLPGTC